MSDPQDATTVPLSMPPTQQGDLLPVSSSGVTVEHVDRKLTMYRVTEEELFTLRGIGPTISLAFFGIMVGAAFSLYTTLQGSTLDRDTRHDLNALFIGARWLAIFFAVVSLVGYVRLWRTVSGIKRRKVVQ